jgi:hypothetical protein
VSAEDIKLYFDDGVDPLSGVLSCLKEDGRVVMYSAGRYKVEAEYLPEGMAEYKFQATKVDNTVKEQVLYDCPRLVDCETTKDVKTYLSEFQGGMDASASDHFEEKEVAFDVDGNPVEVT